MGQSMSASADGIKVFVRQAIFRQGKDNRIMRSSDVLATAAFGYAQDGRVQRAFGGATGVSKTQSKSAKIHLNNFREGGLYIGNWLSEMFQK